MSLKKINWSINQQKNRKINWCEKKSRIFFFKSVWQYIVKGNKKILSHKWIIQQLAYICIDKQSLDIKEYCCQKQNGFYFILVWNTSLKLVSPKKIKIYFLTFLFCKKENRIVIHFSYILQFHKEYILLKCIIIIQSCNEKPFHLI